MRLLCRQLEVSLEGLNQRSSKIGWWGIMVQVKASCILKEVFNIFFLRGFEKEEQCFLVLNLGHGDRLCQYYTNKDEGNNNFYDYKYIDILLVERNNNARLQTRALNRLNPNC